ncbi:MAG: Wzz/FepE/Etk N-terminal domain-containing protein [Pseudomonadota bacterium]
MSDRPSGAHGPASSAAYLPPEEEVRLVELWNIVWAGKWSIIGITFVFAVASVVYALTAKEWYRAEVLLAPAERTDVSSLPGQLGGLAALAGVNVGGGDSVEAIATLLSRDFAGNFITDENLIPVLFADDWDADNQRWISDDPEAVPDIRDAIRTFHEDILRVDEDRGSGLVTVAVEWTDPDEAAAWAGVLIERLNAELRARTLREAEANVAYLQEEMQKTNVVTLQQAVGRLVESELQKLMLARGTKEFAFRIIDPAQPPDRRVRPKRSLIVVVGTFFGGVLSLIWVFLAQALRSPDPAASR